MNADPSLDMGYIIQFLSCKVCLLYGLQEKVQKWIPLEEMQKLSPAGKFNVAMDNHIFIHF